MSSRGRKFKKKAKSDNGRAANKIHLYFTPEEVAEIKTIIKTKDLSGVPVIIAAVILKKIALLKELVKEGYDVNQTGQNNTTALIWAVKLKQLDMIEVLLSQGADPTLKSDSGESILITALEHKTWDQDSFIKLWGLAKKTGTIDPNARNKNGHAMLHMCVRRDWEQSLQLLLKEKPDSNVANTNGVTPLMLACFRGNWAMICPLLESGASILKEDHHGRTSLCYAIASGLATPQISEKVLEEMKKLSSISNYLKRRLEIALGSSERKDFSTSTSEMMIKIIKYAVQIMEGGLEALLGLHVFNVVKKKMDVCINNAEALEFILGLLQEILFYNPDSIGFSSNLYLEIVRSFTKSGLLTFCFHILERKMGEPVSKLAYKVILLGCKEEICGQIIHRHIKLLNSISFGLGEEEPENRSKILQAKLSNVRLICEKYASKPLSDEKLKKTDINCSKRSRRRSKAIKAKLTKIKSAELTKRLNLSTRKPMQQKSAKNSIINNKPNHFLSINDNFIVNSLKHLVEDSEVQSETLPVNDLPKWQQTIMNKPFRDYSQIGRNLNINCQKVAEASSAFKNAKNYDFTLAQSLNLILNYLKELKQLIVRKYQEHWDKDRVSGVCYCKDYSEHVPWMYSNHLRSVENKEQFVIRNLQMNFDHLLRTIKNVAYKNLSDCYKTILQTESLLLNHEIRGIKTVRYISNSETLLLRFGSTTEAPDSLIKHLENVLNGHEKFRDDLKVEVLEEIDDCEFIQQFKNETPEELFEKEMRLIPERKVNDKRKEMEAKLNTIANGFHLVNSIMALCDDKEEKESV